MLLMDQEPNHTPQFAWYEQNSSPSISDRINERQKPTDRTEGETSRRDTKD